MTMHPFELETSIFKYGPVCFGDIEAAQQALATQDTLRLQEISQHAAALALAAHPDIQTPVDTRPELAQTA